MKRTRKRFWAWTLTLTAALLAVVWVGSMKVEVVGVVTPTSAVALSEGAVGVFLWERPPLSRPYANPPNYPAPRPTIKAPSLRWRARGTWSLLWWFGWERDTNTGGTRLGIWAPLWIFVLATGGPGVWMLVKTRRHTNPNACPACGYDRTGLPPTPTGPAPCPECGKSA